MPRPKRHSEPSPYWPKITAIMDARGWSQADLARETGINPAEVSKWANGYCDPSFESLCKIADRARVSVDSMRLDRPSPKGDTPIVTKADERMLIEAYRKDKHLKKTIMELVSNWARALAEGAGTIAPEKRGKLN